MELQEEFKDRKTYDFKQALVNAEAREREAANVEVIKYPALFLM